MNWKIKSIVLRTLAKLPLGRQLHYLLQRRVTKEWPRRTTALDDLIVAAQKLVKDADGRLDLSKSHFLEIGAGRDLAVAIALRLLGVKRITCLDITRLAKPALVASAATHMAARLGKPCPKLETWADIEEFGISYLAPAQLPSDQWPSESIDCFYSVDTLEHIPRSALKAIFTEARRILKPDGLSIHFIDYSDHYARGSDLSRFNFLTFSEREWAPFNSPFQFVNRMRHSEFLELFVSSGLTPFRVEADVEQPQADIIQRLAPEFRRFAQDDLFTIRARIVVTPVPL